MMGDFSIQLSSRLINQLTEGTDQPKRKPKKTKPKVSKKPPVDSGKQRPSTEWPIQPPFFLPITPQTGENPELEAIKSVLRDSEKVLEKLEEQEKNMAHEVTERAKDLREKEFKIPSPKPMPCNSENNAWMNCYKENINDPLKCSSFARSFADCARRVRQQVNSMGK